MKLLTSLILALTIAPAFADVDCKTGETCITLSGSYRDSYHFVSSFRIGGADREIETPHNVFIKYDDKTGEVIVEKDQASLVLGTLGTSITRERYTYPLVLSQGVKFTAKRTKTGVRTTCTSSALAVLNKWKAPVALYEVTGADKKNTVKFDAVVELEQAKGAGICVFRKAGSTIDWD